MDAWSASKYTGTRHWLIIQLVLLMLSSVRLFDLVPLAPLSDGNVSFFFFCLFSFYTLIRNGSKNQRVEFKQIKPLFWLIVSVLLSYIPAYLYFGQSPIQSFFTYRKFICYLALPVLLAVKPTIKEIRHSLYIFAGIWFVVSFLVTFYNPAWVVADETDLFVDEGDIFHKISGSRFIALAFIFALEEYYQTRNPIKAIPVFLTFLCVFVMFSRTIFSAALLIIALAIFSGVKSDRARALGILFMAVFFAVFLYFTRGQIQMMIQETFTQVGDTDYNRNKAFVFMFASQKNYLTVLLGNGFISGHVSTYVADMQEQGIFNCDVGLLGMWQQYGILSVIVILASVIRSLSKDYSFLVRASGLFILTGIITISYFASTECVLWLCFHWYLMSLEDNKVNLIREERKKEKMQRRRKYRSLVA